MSRSILASCQLAENWGLRYLLRFSITMPGVCILLAHHVAVQVRMLLPGTLQVHVIRRGRPMRSSGAARGRHPKHCSNVKRVTTIYEALFGACQKTTERDKLRQILQSLWESRNLTQRVSSSSLSLIFLPIGHFSAAPKHSTSAGIHWHIVLLGQDVALRLDASSHLVRRSRTAGGIRPYIASECSKKKLETELRVNSNVQDKQPGLKASQPSIYVSASLGALTPDVDTRAVRETYPQALRQGASTMRSIAA